MRQPPVQMMRGFRRRERVLLSCALVLVSIYIGNRVYSSLYSQSEVQRFWADRGLKAHRVESRALSPDVVPDFGLWSEKRIKAYRATLLVDAPPPLAVLQISALRLQVPVLEGTDDFMLDRAVGHILGAALPGELGNVGIAGHRDGFFRGLKDIRAGATIDLFHQHGTLRYIVDDIRIVPPTDVSVLAPRAKPAITLVTCYPFYFVGSAPLRYIVHATLADANGWKASEQLRLEAKRRTGPAN